MKLLNKLTIFLFLAILLTTNIFCYEIDNISPKTIFSNHTISIKGQLSKIEKAFIHHKNTKALSIENGPFFVGVRHNEIMSKKQFNKMTSAFDMFNIKNIGIELYTNHPEDEDSHYFLDLKRRLENKGYKLICIDSAEKLLHSNIIQILLDTLIFFNNVEGNFTTKKTSHKKQPNSSFQLIIKKLELFIFNKINTLKDIYSSIPNDKFAEIKTKWITYFSDIYINISQEKDYLAKQIDILNNHIIDIHLERSFIMYENALSLNVDTIILGGGHIKHLLALKDSETHQGLFFTNITPLFKKNDILLPPLSLREFIETST